MSNTIWMVKGNTEQLFDEDSKSEMLSKGWKCVSDVLAEAKKQSEKTPDDSERLKLLEKAKSLGLKPNMNTGIKKLTEMIAEAENSK